jgi:hypothetical protein
VGDSLKRIIVPSLEQIVEINKLFIEKTGGFFVPSSNLLNSSSRDGYFKSIHIGN